MDCPLQAKQKLIDKLCCLVWLVQQVYAVTSDWDTLQSLYVGPGGCLSQRPGELVCTSGFWWLGLVALLLSRPTLSRLVSDEDKSPLGTKVRLMCPIR